MSELPPSEPVPSLNRKSRQKDRTWVAGLSSTNPAAILVKGKIYTKNNSDDLHKVITVYLLLDTSPNGEAAKHTVQVSCKDKQPTAWKETMWWMDTWKTRLPEIWIPLFQHLSALTDYSSSFSRSHMTDSVGNPLCPSCCPSTRSPTSISAFLLLFVWRVFPPSFCFSDIKREKGRWWVTWRKDQSRHWEKRGLKRSLVDYTNRMIYSAKCPDYLPCHKRTVQK